MANMMGRLMRPGSEIVWPSASCTSPTSSMAENCSRPSSYAVSLFMKEILDPISSRASTISVISDTDIYIRGVYLIPWIGRRSVPSRSAVRFPATDGNFLLRRRLCRIASRIFLAGSRIGCALVATFVATINSSDGRCVARSFLRSSFTFRFSFFREEAFIRSGFMAQLSDRRAHVGSLETPLVGEMHVAR